MRIAELDGAAATRWRLLGEHGSLLGGLCFCRYRANSLCTSAESGAGVDCVLGAWSSRRPPRSNLDSDIEGGPRGGTRLEILDERYRYRLRDVLLDLAIFLFF
jgi:hypothetical protein